MNGKVFFFFDKAIINWYRLSYAMFFRVVQFIFFARIKNALFMPPELGMLHTIIERKRQRKETGGGLLGCLLFSLSIRQGLNELESLFRAGSGGGFGVHKEEFPAGFKDEVGALDRALSFGRAEELDQALLRVA